MRRPAPVRIERKKSESRTTGSTGAVRTTLLAQTSPPVLIWLLIVEMDTELPFSPEKQRRNLKFRSELLSNRTPAEIAFASLLTKMGIRFLEQKGWIKGGFHCISDFYLPKQRCCVEIDGPYHLSPHQRVKDDRKDAYLRSRKFRTLRITNEQILGSPEAVESMLRRLWS